MPPEWITLSAPWESEVTEPREESEMTEPLIVAVAQPPCAPHDVAGNARAHAAAVRDTRARVVVFPELSLTGYELPGGPGSGPPTVP